MAKRTLDWKGTEETRATLMRDEEASPKAVKRASSLQTVDTPKPDERQTHRLSLEIYKDQFTNMFKRRAEGKATSVAEQIREAIDQYLVNIETDAE